MAAATITKSWQVANNGGWAETFNFYSSPGQADDISGCTAQLNLIRNGRPSAEVLTFNSTDVTPWISVTGSPAAVTVAIPPSVTIGWDIGAYDVQLRVIPSGDPATVVDRYNLVGPGRVNVIEAPGT